MPVKIKIDIQEGGKKSQYIVESSSFTKVKEEIINHLNNYRPETYEPSSMEHSSTFKPEYLPNWLLGININDLTQKEKVLLLLKNNHSDHWVRSQDLRIEYNEIFGEDIKLSSLSTYLARYFDEGALERRGSRAQREYRLPERAAALGI
ncbi:MAG: hypothetical protein ACE5G7_00905 [Candidatus Hydrothermarchaeaceae archaeon]